MSVSISLNFINFLLNFILKCCEKSAWHKGHIQRKGSLILYGQISGDGQNKDQKKVEGVALISKKWL